MSVIPYTSCGADGNGTSPEAPLVISVILRDSAEYHSPGPTEYMADCPIPTASEFSMSVGEIEIWEDGSYWPGFVAHVIGKAIGFG